MSTSLSTELESALENLIHQEIDELRKFIRLLDEELDALAAGRTNNVHDCMSRKRIVLGRIFAARDAVNAAARSASSNPHLKPTEPWLAHASPLRIRHVFHRLADHAHEARQLSQLANRLIRIKLPGSHQGQEVLTPNCSIDADYYPQGLRCVPRRH